MAAKADVMKKRVRRHTGASRTSNTLGCLVRRVRAANGWTLRELSGKVDIPESTLSKVETGKLTLTYDRLQQFASRLGMSMAEFLAPTDVSTVSHAGTAQHRAQEPGDRRQPTAGLDTMLRFRVPVRRVAR